MKQQILLLFTTIFVVIVQCASTTFYKCSCQCPYGSDQGFTYTTINSSQACVRACSAVPSNPCIASNTYACLGTDCAYSDSYDNSTETRASVSYYVCSCQCPYGSSRGLVLATENSTAACVRACIVFPLNPCLPSNTYACLGTNCAYSDSYVSSIETTTPAPLVRCSCECRYGSTRSFVYTRENSTEGCLRACMAIPSDTCNPSDIYACLGTECAFSILADDSSEETTITTTTVAVPHYQCSCQCPYGSNSSYVNTTENSPQGCVKACITDLHSPCFASNTYACLGTDCAYSDSYNNTTTAAVWIRQYFCSCRCPYGSTPSYVLTSENSTEGCIKACIASPSNQCIASNTYACLGTNCAYSNRYSNATTSVGSLSFSRCSCQCPYGSRQSFVYTTEHSPEGCVRACISTPFNPCVRWNTYACLGTNCAYSSSYLHSRRILASSQYSCSCSCPQGSSRTSAVTTDNSPQACAVACNSTLEINVLADNTTIDSIIDDFESTFDLNSFDPERNESTITSGGMTFGATEEKTDLIDPRDVSVLASYRRAVARHMYTDEARFEQVQIRVRRHLLKTLGCNITYIEKILQWSWIPRTKCGYRLIGQPLKVPTPKNGKVYSVVRGISFYDNGSFILNLVEANEDNALFNSDDVELVMKRGITGASFSLDPPLASDLPHPFQKGTWAPYNALKDTDFLATMLHADLWLKSMSFLVEASAKSPFRIRSMRDGVYSALSEDLYQRLFKENHLEQDKYFSATRMWIESGPIKYNIIEQNGNLTYAFGPSNMQVKYQNLLRRVRNQTTGLIDTIIESNSSWHDHFSATATENYNELGNSFPELLRLAELAKLTAIALIFQHRYRELRKTLQPPSIETVAKVLTDSNLRGQVFGGTWPLVTAARIEAFLDNEIRAQGLNIYQKHLINNVDQIRAQIRLQLIAAENKQIKEITESLQKAFNISAGTISRAAIYSYMANTHSNAEHTLLNEIVAGITSRMRTSQAGAIRLYETMSRSGYDVGSVSSTLPEFAQVSSGKGPIEGFESSGTSSCYYIPTQITLTYHGNGSFLQQRGGIKLQPRLEYQQDPVSTPQAQTGIPDIPLLLVTYRKNKGPQYKGHMQLGTSPLWNRMLAEGKATENDKHIIGAMSRNEGNLDTVHSYDSEILTAGAMQKTINSKGTGEFPVQVAKFRDDNPELYKKLFADHCWTVKKEKDGYRIYYNEQTGQELKTYLRTTFTMKEKIRTSEALSTLVHAISSTQFQQQQIMDFVDRLHKRVLPIQPTGYAPYKIEDYLQSNLGRATALDQHINRPGYVQKDFSDALNALFKKHPKLSKNPADWGEKRSEYEQELVNYYGEHRRMTDSVRRFQELKDNL